jgi:hypothetical protein
MDRLIWTAWRAFWVGLGASAVLITQSLLAAPASTAPVPPSSEDGPSAPLVEPARAERDVPVTPQGRFDLTRGKVVARIRNAS